MAAGPDGKTLRALDVLNNKADEKTFIEQMAEGKGFSAINLQGQMPSYWFERMLGVEAKEFIDKRNHIMSQDDLFENDSCRIYMTRMNLT